VLRADRPRRERSLAADPVDSTEQLVLGVSWPDRVPHLDLASVQDFRRSRVPVLGRLGFRVTADGRYCTGWYGFDDDGGRLWPCPDRHRTSGSRQCADCALRDQFRFAHQGHVGGYVPAELEPYLRQPHWLYVATFADGFSKVGTAAQGRKVARLDDQGPALAAYVAQAADGRLVREAEDALTRELALPQHRRGAAKAVAVAHPAPADRVAARHTETVAQATRLLGETVWGPGLTVAQEEWRPPDAMGVLRRPPPRGSWVEYPHDLALGSHGLRVEACAGAVALARTEEGLDAVAQVVDLSRLKGVRLELGAYRSPAAEVQEAMF
jgi:hypothetical protein